MSDAPQKIVPIKIELDSDESLRSALNGYFIKNLRQGINRNSNAAIDGNAVNQGANVGALTPIQSPEMLCAGMVLPDGDNVCTGAFNSVKTGEIYWEVWNAELRHTIWVYDTINGCRKVYQGECLGFRFEPEFHLPAHRCTLFVVYDADDAGTTIIKNKYYVFSDGVNWQFFIDVESAIATDSYNPITYPYFKTYYPHCDPCEFIQLGIRPPQNCPIRVADDTPLQIYQTPPENNNLKEKVWYVATYFIDVFGRRSVISPYSTATFIDGGDCPANVEDNKCFLFRLDAGSAFVDKIVFCFSNDGVNWFKSDTIDKWNDCTSPETMFWERELALNNYYAPNAESPACNEMGSYQTLCYEWDLSASPSYDTYNTIVSIVIDSVTYTKSTKGLLVLWLNDLNKGTFTFEDGILSVCSNEDATTYGTVTIMESPAVEFEPTVVESEQTGTVNTFIYQFCANKQCIPIDPAEVSRIFDDLPISSVGQIQIDDRLAYGNNLRGYDNFICPLEQIQIEAVQDEPSCELELVDITIDCVVHNFSDRIGGFIYQPESSTDIAFGGTGTSGHVENEVISAYNQQIVNEHRGFIGGFRGTNYKVVSQQYRLADSNTTVIPEGIGFNKYTKSLQADIYAGNYFIQRFKFKVPKGSYIFEIYSHLANGFDDCEGTSTYWLGTIPKGYYLMGYNLNPLINKNERELFIDACDGNVDYAYYVVIADLTKPKASVGLTGDAKSVCGYLREKETNLSVELAELHINSIIDLQSFGTDANGFYFAMNTGSDYIIHINLLNPTGCAATDAHHGGDTISEKQLTQLDLFVDNAADGMPFDQFNDCGHELIEGLIEDCDGNPIPGISVVLSRTGRYAVTDINGEFTLLAHDNANIFSQTGQTRKTENVDFLVISPQGICSFNGVCDNCDTCFPPYHIAFITSCFHCISQSPATTAQQSVHFVLDVTSSIPKGLKAGGTYAVSIIGYDDIDRNNEAQLVGTFNVPTIQSNSVFAPYHFNWSFIGAMNFPSWVKKIRFAVRANNYTFLLSWATNKVEFVDSAGNITAPDLATNIRVYINGLNDFNEENLLNTNTAYSWVAGDRIRFITNGDGTVFTTAGNDGLIDLPVSKLENGSVLLIPFDPRLADLTAFATFELYRVPVCEEEAVYYEQCPTIPVIDGEPVTTSGTIPFFDTYWFFRNIPMTNQDGLPVVFTNQRPYEHFAPSDFWGTAISGSGANSSVVRLFSIGRPFVRNENARQTWYINEDSWSDALLTDGSINGLGTWRTENRKNYILQDAGGTVAMKAQDGFIFHLCENNWFVVNISQNLLVITAGGNVQANPDYFGNRQQKIGNIYGCDKRDTSTIVFREEWIMWDDVTRGAKCFSNYQTVWDVTKQNEGISEGNMQSYWIEKYRKVASLRENNQYTDSFMFLHSGYSIKSNELVTTAFTRLFSPSVIEYGSDADDYDIDNNETVSYSLGGYFTGNYAFTPERYIDFDSGANGFQLISFVQGRPYIHNKINPATESFNNFYGTQYRSIIRFIMNGGEGANQTQKIFLAVRVLCKEQKFYCDKANTETGQLSRIPPEAFERMSNYFEAPILMDENSAIVNGLSKLIDGTNLYGNWISLRFVGEEGKENEYFELLGFIVSSTESY